MKKFLAVAIGVAFMVGSNYGNYKIFQAYKGNAETMETIMPARFIHPGEIITPELLRQVTIPIPRHAENALLDATQIVGKAAITPIGFNEEILTWKVGERPTMPAGNQYLVSFPIDAVKSVANFVRKGDKVDISVEFTEPKRIKDKTSGSLYYLADLKVADNVTVNSVKGSDGFEVVDTDYSKQVLDAATNQERILTEEDLHSFRSSPSAQPISITFVMDDASYNAYTLAQTLGNIRLKIKNPFGSYNYVTLQPTVDPLFTALRSTEFFRREKVDRNNPSAVAGLANDYIAEIDLSLTRTATELQPVDLEASGTNSQAPAQTSAAPVDTPPALTQPDSVTPAGN